MISVDVYIRTLYNDRSFVKDTELKHRRCLSESKVIYGPLLRELRPYGQPGPLPMIGSPIY